MRIYLGLGANIGNREANLRLALRSLAPACTIVAVSSLYRSAALVLDGAGPGPDFLNAACEIDTGLTPLDLLLHLKAIEQSIEKGRGKHLVGFGADRHSVFSHSRGAMRRPDAQNAAP